MKKRTIAWALALLIGTTAGAQTVYDAMNITQKELNGTARFVGMGGAMGALGGDLSTMNTNPAGIGIYRSCDVATTLSYNILSTSSEYMNNRFDNTKYRWNFDNIGFVYAMKIGNQTPLRYVNFGFNYAKSKMLYRNMTMSGLMGQVDGAFLSQVRTMEDQACQNDPYIKTDFDSPRIWEDYDAGWLGVMGIKGNLLDNELYAIVPNEVDAFFHSQERGGVDRFDFNMAFNINDRFYIGATIGAYDVDYKKYTLYDEDYGNKEGYSLETDKRISGSGFDFKLGMIARPFEDSPLRLGVAIHTPTWYNLTYETGARLDADVLFEGDTETTRLSANTVSDLRGNMVSDFELVTPWVFNASLGYTVGSMLALGAEYEYEDYSSMKFRYPDGGDMEFENNETDLCLKATHTVRLGMELKPVSSFALRAGYNYSSAAFKNDAIKALPVNSISTDTDFSNHKEMNTLTLGIGYRGKMIYTDLAYKYNWYKSDFYPFYNQIGDQYATAPATKVDNERSQVLFTLGVRF